MIKSIVTNLAELKKPCIPVVKEDNYKEIIQDLKDTLATKSSGLGLAANQIGYNKRICYLRILKGVSPDKKLNYSETILINPKIIEKDKPIKLVGEGCLSFPGIQITTKRYVYVTIEFLDENLKPQVAALQDYESLSVQHEIEHINGITFFDRKWKAK